MTIKHPFNKYLLNVLGTKESNEQKLASAFIEFTC